MYTITIEIYNPITTDSIKKKFSSHISFKDVQKKASDWLVNFKAEGVIE